MTREEVLEFLEEENPEAAIFENPSFEKALIGYTENNLGNYVAVYDYNLMIESLSEEYSNESEDPITDAIDWVEYNTMRSLPYMGENAPIIIYA